jgi:UDP-3-O-[3-hydroxymyristoyl] glucosamine N-acyltransferase
MKLFILGNGSFAQEVFEQIVVENSIQDFGGFVILRDNKAFAITEEGSSDFTYPKNAQFVLGTSNQLWRSKFLEHFCQYYEMTPIHWPNMKAPACYLSTSSSMGIGNLFLSFSLVNANAEVGDFNLFNIYSSVNNDCVVGDENIFHQYASAINGVSVGDNNLISAGEVLFDSIENDIVFQSGIGIPND